MREVGFDEVTHSWHPKAALVRTCGADGKQAWRLWIGSRNLTECVNRDIGLLLVSGHDGVPVSGAGDLTRALAERAKLTGVRPAPLASTIAKLRWRAPAGVLVERIRWSAGGGGQEVPIPPEGADEIVIVSPFVDRTFLDRQVSKGGAPARRVLLTTVREIERTGPSLAAFDDLLALDAPEFPISDPAQEPPQAEQLADGGEDREGEEEIGRGLHAKLLFARAGRRRTLWLGSANATMRGWDGRNAEVTAELRVTEAVERGLKALLNSAHIVPAPAAEYSPDAEVLEEEALERARAQVAARWAVSLGIEDDMVRLDQGNSDWPGGPHPDDPSILLEVGALHGELKAWPLGQSSVELGPILPAERSELVRLRVSREGKGLSWLQRAPADPPFGADRDRAAFVRLLGARGFLLWLAGLLADDGRGGEEDWTIERRSERAGTVVNPALDPNLPTLEEMMAAWSRDRDRFREIERRVADYLPAVREQARLEDPVTADLLAKFEDLWGKLRAGLGDERQRRPR